MDVLREVKKMLKLDLSKRRKLTYAIKSNKLLLYILKMKLRSIDEESRRMLKKKSSNKHKKYSTSFDFQKMHSVEMNDMCVHKDNPIFHNKIDIKMNRINEQNNITQKLNSIFKNENYLIGMKADSSELPYSLQNFLNDNRAQFNHREVDVLRYRKEAENIRSQTSLLLKLRSTSETLSSNSVSSFNEQNLLISSKKMQMKRALNESTEQYIAAISSESDLSSSMTPITNSFQNYKSYTKLKKTKTSSPLHKNLRRIKTRSHSNNSSSTLTSTIKYDRRSYSYFSRSTSSSQMSRYIFSDSSRSRSPSIPRRRGSPSFLERRRITSARKRPILYRRLSLSSSNSSPSLCSKKSFKRTSYDACTPEIHKTNQSSKLQ